MTRKPSKAKVKTPLAILKAIDGSKPDPAPARMVRLEVDAETFGFFGGDVARMQEALRTYADAECVKMAYEKMRDDRNRSK